MAARREEVREIERSLKGLQSRLQDEESEGRAKMQARLKEEQVQARLELEKERASLERDRAELRRQETMLRENLEQVTKELRAAGDDVVNRYLAIAPLLGATLGPGGLNPSSPREGSTERAVETFDTPLSLPAYMSGSHAAPGDSLAEEAFFDRFRRVVEENGFTYRLFDLQRFHVSVKCGDLTVLGGPSGTGKSSLATLYGLALLGDQRHSDRTGCLMVNINPSWMDVRDLLGHMNTLERRFYPAESGLFQFLICAQEEHAQRLGSTGIYLACLDEMNLSQVEHYFSDFMLALERRGEQRAIQCFSEHALPEQSPFHKWARIQLPPSLRFVGTVNFDETTRLLSDRLLDRANLIRLASGTLPGFSTAEGSNLIGAEGRLVSLGDFQLWQSGSALPTELGSLLDRLRPLLSTMGCPLSPRVYRAVCRFVSSSAGVMAPEISFDAQLAQRIIPKIRSLVTRSQTDALDTLIETLESSSVGTFDESRMLLEEIREAARSPVWEIGE